MIEMMSDLVGSIDLSILWNRQFVTTLEKRGFTTTDSNLPIIYQSLYTVKSLFTGTTSWM